MRNSTLIGLFSLSLLSASAGAVYGQPATRRVKHAVTCASCRLEFTRVATIGRGSDPVEITHFSELARDSQGRYFAFSHDMQLIVYDSLGNFVRTVGRKGQGPGEFEHLGVPSIPPRILIGARDSIFIFQQEKITVLSPELVFVRSARRATTIPTSIAPLADGTWLVSAEVRTRELRGFAMHVLDARGEQIRSLGPRQPIGPRHYNATLRHFLLSPSQREIWFHTSPYTFEQWDLHGTHVQTLQIHDFTSLLASRTPPADDRIGTGMLGIDSLGRFWMNVSPRVAQRTPSTTEPTRLLELIDPRTGGVLSSQMVDHIVVPFPKSTVADSASTADDGFTSYEVFRFRLVR